MFFLSYKILKISTRQDRQLHMRRNCHANTRHAVSSLFIPGLFRWAFLSLMSNTPKLSRIVLKQRRFESARGSKTSDSPEVRLAELDLPEVRSRINAQGGEKF